LRNVRQNSEASRTQAAGPPSRPHGLRPMASSLGVLMLVLAGATAVHADPAQPLGYRYFRKHVALDLDMARVAVLCGAEELPEEQYQRAGLAGAARTPLAIPRGSLALLDTPARSPADLRAVIGRMLQRVDDAFLAPVLIDAQGDPVVPTRTLLVGFDASVEDLAARQILVAQLPPEDQIERWPSLTNGYRVHCSTRNGFDVLELANRLADLDAIAFAQPDLLSSARALEIPSDPLFSEQWGLHNTGQSGGSADLDMNIPEAREYTTGDDAIVIAILDNGMQLDHPDIGPVSGVDFTGNGTAGGPGNECDNHATLLAGTIRSIANNAIGIAGVAPQCALVSVKYGVSTVPCNGNGTFLTSWLVDAIAWCQNNGVRITNNSNALNPQAAVTTKYQETHAGGVLHVASSGNFFSPLVSYPANLPTVVAVGAIDRTGARAAFSNYGTGLALMAPGVDIVTTDRTGTDGQVSGDYDIVEGTSFSAPYAAAVGGLVLAVNPALTPAEVEIIMRGTALDLGAPGYDTQYGDGLVRAQEAVVAAGARLPTPTFADCLAGPQTYAPPPACSDLQFELCDFDLDDDVDLRDFQQFTE
jgi:subtilisin family serine protease